MDQLHDLFYVTLSFLCHRYRKAEQLEVGARDHAGSGEARHPSPPMQQRLQSPFSFVPLPNIECNRWRRYWRTGNRQRQDSQITPHLRPTQVRIQDSTHVPRHRHRAPYNIRNMSSSKISPALHVVYFKHRSAKAPLSNEGYSCHRKRRGTPVGRWQGYKEDMIDPQQLTSKPHVW